MSLRPFTREQAWLLPPALGELIPAEHPVRMVAAFVAGLDAGVWGSLEVNDRAQTAGAPAYHPQALISAWLYGFMTGVRSSRKLEDACRYQLPFLWLVGGEPPDHNTLWRFYKQHRRQMRILLKRTVRVAVRLGLIDWAVQAVDGTKIGGNAARVRSYDAAALTKLLARTEAAIADLEAQNVGDATPPPTLPKALAQAQGAAGTGAAGPC